LRGADIFPLFDVLALRRDFPILHQEVNGKPLAFLDSGASSQRPRRVIDCIEDYYRRYHANVHRGIYKLSEEATFAYERARGKVSCFIGATNPREIIFTRNTTEAINLVAYSWGTANVHQGDRILLTLMEHHSNIVPWMMLAERVGASIDYIRVDGEGRLVLEDLDTMLTERTKMVAVTHQSNVLGTINPIQFLAKRAHAVGALILVDGAQSVPHMTVNVRELGIDFLALSGHKMCGPTGSGALWGRYELLDSMPPFLGGGSMIKEVHLDGFTLADVPIRFEAGTPAIAECIALGEAIDFLHGIGMDKVHGYEHELTACTFEHLNTIDGLTIYGPHSMENRGGIVSFTLDGIHAHDVSMVLDGEGIAVRSGHHCAQPLHQVLGVSATTRASFYLYNIPEEVERLAQGLRKVKKLLG
jgi:cysteine desulfurase / selenocysteine lyase